MIFYFSGTGNSKWIAKKIAEMISDKAYDISKLNEIPKITNESQIGLIFPIYAWGIPEPMTVFVKKLKKTKAFTFGISTCGSEAGNALKQLSKIYHLDSCYSIIMPSNYIIGEDIEDKATILEKFGTKNVINVYAVLTIVLNLQYSTVKRLNREGDIILKNIYKNDEFLHKCYVNHLLLN